jgi:hypothetical protein
MSRWAIAFRAALNDTIDSIDTTGAGAALREGSVNSVNCVTASGTDEFGEPLVPCPECGGVAFWRLSRIDPGFPGRWWCAGCSPSPEDRWTDAAVLPRGARAI